VPTILLKRPEVTRRTGLSRSTLYVWMGRGAFPKPIKLGTRSIAWRESDIEDWINEREQESR
jgi:prophage regulatory protein